jgi:hypothetical protein
VTKAVLDKAIAITQKYNIVTIRPTLVKEEDTAFLDAVLDRARAREVWELPDDHPGYFVCTCTSQEFYESGSISEEIVIVFAFLNLINIGVLTAQIVPRRARGRPKTVSSWDDVSGGPRAQNAAWFLKDIERNRKMNFY